MSELLPVRFALTSRTFERIFFAISSGFSESAAITDWVCPFCKGLGGNERTGETDLLLPNIILQIPPHLLFTHPQCGSHKCRLKFRIAYFINHTCPGINMRFEFRNSILQIILRALLCAGLGLVGNELLHFIIRDVEGFGWVALIAITGAYCITEAIFIRRSIDRNHAIGSTRTMTILIRTRVSN